MQRQWPLAGRKSELQLIAGVLGGDTERGMIIGGPAGVGKSRLAHEVGDAMAARGWTVRRIACTATGRSIPLGAFAQWVDGGGQTAVAMAERMIETMTSAANGPLLICIDDAHLIDEVSAFVLHQIVVRDLGKVLATVRDGEAVLDAITAPWKDGLLRWLDLIPLDHADSAELLRSALDAPLAKSDADRLWTLTQGNVLLLRHLVIQELSAGRLRRHGNSWRWDDAAMVTPSLRQLVDSQIGAVPARVRDVVDLVAVAEPLDRRCLASLVASNAIEDAERRNLITTGGDLIRVGHPLYAEVRLAQSPPSGLRRLRGRVATVLRSLPTGRSPDAIKLGLLWLESDLEPDPDVLLAAAELAAARQDAALAERLARGAVDAGGGTKAKLQQAYALCQLGRGDDAQLVLDLIEPADVPGNDYVNDVILRAETLMGPLRRPDEAWRVIDAALAESSGSRTHQLRTCRAVQAVMAGRPADALAVMATVDFSQLDPFGRMIGFTSQTAALGELGDADAASATAAAGCRVLAHAPGAVHQATAIGEFHTVALFLAGRVHEALAVADGYFRDCEALAGLPLTMATAAVGAAALSAGNLGTAIRSLDPDRLGFSPHDDVSGLTHRFWALYAEALARSGDLGGATVAIARARALHHPSWAYVEPTSLLAQAWVHAARGRVTSACDLGRQAAAVARAQGQRAREVLSLQACIQFGDTAVVAERLDELAAVVGGPRVGAVAAYARAIAAGDADGVAAVSREFEEMGDRLAAADAAAHAAALHRARGRRGAALSASGRALQLAADCGGATSPAIASARVVLPITNREREVASLVAEGLSNREIANLMGISVRTVESHVQRACAKTGLSTRLELAELVGPATQPAAR